ncbi:MAG: hypothetical protein LBR16_03840 [Treponema sp.]|nr:hypothetical protein [Treponema sp.]
MFEAPTYDEAVVKAGETGFEVILSYEGRNTQVAFWSVLYPPVGKVRVIAKDADGIRPATVNDMDLTALVPKPLTGADKVTAFQSQEQYTGTVIWKVYTDTNNFWAPFTMTKFAANKVYQAVVTLKPKTSLFSFKGVAKNSFKHTQADSVTNDANSGVVTITFPATAALQPDTGAAQ